MATIDATEAGPSANCYVTLAFADSYFADGLEADDWDSFDDDQKTRALIAATRQLDNLRLWGDKHLASQALEFPRSDEPYQHIYYEALTASHDTAVSLNHDNLTANSVKVTSQADDDGTTYTETTDYTADDDNGTITVLSTGTISDAATVYVSYTYLGLPEAVEHGTCEQALWLLQQRANPELLDRRGLQQQGVRGIGMDGLSETLVGTGPESAWSPRAWEMVQGYVQRVGRVAGR
jgi:hypothetical protein